MKFWCASANSSKQHKLNTSLSSSVSYATISSIPIQKSDSGFSETTSSIETYSCLEQIFLYEKTYHEHLKQYIIKYSRPLRRYLPHDDIVQLFQNIEKISAISESIVRQLHDKHHTFNEIYQSWFGTIIDSYSTYITRCSKAQVTLKQCQDKISYFLQIPIEFIKREMTVFILLPLRYICILNDLISMNEGMQFLATKASCILQDQPSILESSQDMTLQSEIEPIVVFQRTDKDLWKSKRLELSDSKLSFTTLDQSSITTSIYLSNVIHIDEDFSNKELRFIVASTMRNSSCRMKRIYIRFEDRNDYCTWLHCLTDAVQDAKDQSWWKTNEIFI